MVYWLFVYLIPVTEVAILLNKTKWHYSYLYILTLVTEDIIWITELWHKMIITESLQYQLKKTSMKYGKKKIKI